MSGPKILAFVLAGGEGSRLKPLTSNRSKPAVPFGARYRIVDFALSNLVNSGITAIYLLVQYRSQSLIEHVRKAWSLSPTLWQQFITIVPPQHREAGDFFQGTADAVFQNLNMIGLHEPDLVVVFGADHIYRMDLRQMIGFHLEQCADVTVSALPVPLADASSFGVLATDDSGRITKFQEKPAKPEPMPTDPARAFASMGNYVFSTPVLVEALREANRLGENDFGRHVLPRLLGTHRLFAYDFMSNVIPGVKPYEEPGYWRDVGTIDAYYDAHYDVLGRTPRFDVYNPAWPIYSSNYQGPVARIYSGKIENSIFGAGTIVDGATVRNSIIRREVVLEEGAEVEDCIIMDYARIGRGAKLRRVIVDQLNQVAPDERIGFDAAADRTRFDVTESGIVVVAKPDDVLGGSQVERYI
jgi:glucose-1-phosphate adenylyltransferase